MKQRVMKHTPLPVYIYGTHAVAEALKHKPGAIVRVLRARSRVLNKDIEQLLVEKHIKIADFDPKTPPAGVPEEAAHQGIVAEVTPGKITVPFAQFIKNLVVTDDTALVVLGELQDPQNVGAIIRSAAAFGVAGVLIPEHRQAQITGTVVKVSAGTAFSVPLVSIGNVNTVLRDLKTRGFWTYALSGSDGVPIGSEDFRKPSVLVVGNEGDGVRDKTRETCDMTLAIPIHPRCESLNASASVAITLYAWSATHPRAIS